MVGHSSKSLVPRRGEPNGDMGRVVTLNACNPTPERMSLVGRCCRKSRKIEPLSKSRERRCLPAAASASIRRTHTKLCGRLLVIRRGPSHQRAQHAPAVLKNLVHCQKNLFRQHRSFTSPTTVTIISPFSGVP